MEPLKATGHISILKGNLAPGGAVGKITGKQGLNASPARPASTTARKTCSQGLEDGKIQSGDVIVIRYEGPQGRPRHARDAHADQRAVAGAGLPR